MRIAILLALLSWVALFGSFMLTCWAGGNFKQGPELQFWIGGGLFASYTGAIFVGQIVYDSCKKKGSE